jgi:hypothetical protein
MKQHSFAGRSKGAASIVQPSKSTPFSLLSFLLSQYVSRKLAAAGHISRSARQSMLLHDGALASASGLTRVLAPFHLRDYELESFEDVLIVARAGLGPRAFELFGKGFAVFWRDLTLFGTEIGFIANDYNGHPVDGLVLHMVRFSACALQRSAD